MKATLPLLYRSTSRVDHSRRSFARSFWADIMIVSAFIAVVLVACVAVATQIVPNMLHRAVYGTVTFGFLGTSLGYLAMWLGSFIFGAGESV